MQVLVTGGAGYIGSVVTEELLRAGHAVVVYDNLSKGHRDAVPAEADFLQGDLLDADTLRYFNAAGAGERCGERHSPETHLIPLILQAAAGQRPEITVYGEDYPTPD